MSKLERGAYAGAARRQRLMISLTTQSLLFLALLVAAFFARGDTLSLRLYLWAALVPIGFAVTYVLAFQRAERVRAAGEWTPEWEAAQGRRGYAWLGVIFAVWIAGSIAILSLN